MLNRLIASWVYGGFLAGVLLLLLAPVIVGSWPAVLVAVFLCLPAYMLHQYEEHDNDRFRKVINQLIGHGAEVLSPLAVFIINVPGVWGVIGITVYLAAMANIGFGLIAFYLLLVNGVIHIVQAIVSREYNPGLGTSIAIFLPLGAFGLYEVQRAGAGTASMHVTGLFVAVGIHVAIVVHVRRKLSLG